ncbi:acetyl-CoA carboxylase biotin carboxyl carrier protein, partial [Arthrobacter deserti]|nr:acetyl-CoA carboxylase biotin carboxyl carrier protein [Arthrobacter deserti]
DFLYEQGDLRIHVRRGGYIPENPAQAPARSAAETGTPAAAPAPLPAPAAAPQPAAAPVPAAPVPAAPTQNGKSHGMSPEALPPGHVLVTAPMLGTFYGAPKPGEPAFVQVGDPVAADSVLCIVEVMKLMNSVAAGAAGEIAAVFVKDGDLVEFEQPLFAIRTAS